jgi:hypothetical protein
MTPAAMQAREALFQDVLAGRSLDPARVAVVARLAGITAAALLLDLLAEAGVA